MTEKETILVPMTREMMEDALWDSDVIDEYFEGKRDGLSREEILEIKRCFSSRDYCVDTDINKKLKRWVK